MAIRVDSASFSGTGICVGGSGLGVKGSVIRATTATGTHGPGLLYDDWDSAADDNKEFRAFITSWPAGATLFVHEDGSFSLTGADGSYTIGYRLDIDGVSQGTASETVNLGVLTVQQDYASTRDLLAVVQQDFASTRPILAVVQADFAATRTVESAVVIGYTNGFALNGAALNGAARVALGATPVQQDFSATRTILAAVQQDFTATRELLAAGSVQQDFAGTRAILAAVQADFAGTRTVLGAVQQDFAATRTLLAPVQQDFMASREIEAPGQVSADFTAVRTLLAPVQQDFSATREIEAPLSVQADFTASRVIAQVVYVDFTAGRLIAPENLIGDEVDVIRPPVPDRHITRSAVADRSVVRPAREPNIRRAA